MEIGFSKLFQVPLQKYDRKQTADFVCTNNTQDLHERLSSVCAERCNIQCLKVLLTSFSIYFTMNVTMNLI